MNKFYSFSPFGYEGTLVSVETDIRKGIPLIDIVGISEGDTREFRERLRTSLHNSNIEIPAERILISLSPADVKKSAKYFDLATALSIVKSQQEDESHENSFLAYGSVDLNGKLMPVDGIFAAVSTAAAAGIDKAIVPKECVKEAAAVQGMKIYGAENITDAYRIVDDEKQFLKNEIPTADKKILFSQNVNESEKTITGDAHAIEALVTAVAGREHMLMVGVPGCGKTLICNYAQYLQPKNDYIKSQPVTRIYSLAGLQGTEDSLITEAPFRKPHPAASIEAMCGGGPHCHPGEISLAHNGILFIDEAQDFRTTCIQMLRVPMIGKQVTLARAGRTTVYPSDFQLLMTASITKDLNSKEELRNYWKKFQGPLLSKIDIHTFAYKDKETEKTFTLDELRDKIRVAQKMQYERQGKLNGELSDDEIRSLYSHMPKDCQKRIDEMSEDRKSAVIKTSRTIADLNEKRSVTLSDIIAAEDFCTQPVSDIDKYKSAEEYIESCSIHNSNYQRESILDNISSNNKGENKMERTSFILDAGNDQPYLLIKENNNPVYYHDYFPNGATSTQYADGLKAMYRDAMEGVKEGIAGWEGNEINDYVAADFTPVLSYNGKWNRLEERVFAAEDFMKVNNLNSDMNGARCADNTTQTAKTVNIKGVEIMDKTQKQVEEKVDGKKQNYPESLFNSIMTHLEKGDSVLQMDLDAPYYPQNMYSNAVYSGINAATIMQGIHDGKKNNPYVATINQFNFNDAKVKNAEQNNGQKVAAVGTAFQWVKQLHYQNDMKDEKGNVIHKKGTPICDKDGNTKSGNMYFSLYSVSDAVDIKKRFQKDERGGYKYDHYEILGPAYKETAEQPKKLPPLVPEPSVDCYKADGNSIDERTMEFLSHNFRHLYNGGRAEKGSKELFAEMRAAYTGKEMKFLGLASKADAYSRSDMLQVKQIEAKKESNISVNVAENTTAMKR